MHRPDYDIILAGGGLAGTLAAYRLRQTRPDLRVLLLERGSRLGGNHTWSFHDTDITPAQRAWLSPFITHRWPAQGVRFPRYRRRLSVGYNSILSETLHDAAMALLEGHVRFGAEVRELRPDAVMFEDGETLRARCVVDARGAPKNMPLCLRYQKFLGLVVRTEAPHGQQNPIIMDATVSQRDGYRFVYTLPLGPDLILIEDTYYSDNPEIDERHLREACLEYARARGWKIAEALREESGVLPVVLGGDIDAVLAQGGGVPVLGVRAALFHYTTSYSLPIAVDCAELVARTEPLTSANLAAVLADRARRHWRSQRLFRLLNRMLFLAAAPDERRAVLERFYRLPQPLIERFYAGRPAFGDWARILSGRPPVPLGRALRSVLEKPEMRSPAERVSS